MRKLIKIITPTNEEIYFSSIKKACEVLNLPYSILIRRELPTVWAGYIIIKKEYYC